MVGGEGVGGGKVGVRECVCVWGGGGGACFLSENTVTIFPLIWVFRRGMLT